MNRSIRSYNDVVEAYNIKILQQPGDWSFEDGGLARTVDGDIKQGDDAYNALFRLVQLWRYNETHFQYLFDAATEMVGRHSKLDDELNEIGNRRMATRGADPWAGFDEFAKALHDHSDSEGFAYFGANTYAGCLIVALGNLVQRFKRDLSVSPNWNTTAPTFGRCSIGNIVIAAANGYRHEDEWAAELASKGKLTARQRASHDVIVKALSGQSIAEISGMARTPEILHLLSGGSFDRLANNIFEFANNIGEAERKATASRRG